MESTVNPELVRMKNGVVPFGYRMSNEHSGYLEPVENEIEYLNKAITYVRNGDLSLRNAADWLHTKTNRRISAMGLSKLSKRAE
jgi:hypothetical protein